MSYRDTGRAEAGWFVTFATNTGEMVRAEIEPTDDDFMPVSAVRPVAKLEHLFGPVIRAAGAAVSEARAVQPDEVTVSFGIKLTGSGEAVLSKNSTERHFEITLNWTRSQDDDIRATE
ncbi:CU044_2847 family protein [Streptomyces sp. NPDC048484]|uniref:CU044_2847 family protein n=1 Tax=Streptomyces sp. NPDC048484 TaxID=3155146 RepID=UPI00342E22FB